MRRAARRPAARPEAEPAPSTLEPRTWQGILYRPCQGGAGAVRRLFQYAGAFTPVLRPEELAWEAEVGERLVGGAVVERQGAHGMIHGPVVVEPPEGTEPLEVAAQLVAALIAEATAAGLDSIYARPPGPDRVWVRAGFVPCPKRPCRTGSEAAPAPDSMSGGGQAPMSSRPPSPGRPAPGL